MKRIIRSLLLLSLFPAASASAQQVTQVSLTTNDLLFEPVTGKLYASVPGSAGANGNSIAVIDPASGAIEHVIWVGSEPNRLAASDDGQYLYVGLDGAYSVRRIDLATLTPGLQFGLGSATSRAGGIAVMPGSPGTVAVARTSGSTTSTAIYDEGVQRPTVTASGYYGNALAFGASASRLYNADNYSSGYEFTRMTVTASGVTLDDTAYRLVGPTSRMTFLAGVLYSDGGIAVDPEALAGVGDFPGSFASVAIDRAQPLAYGMTYSSPTTTLQAFDRSTFRPVWSLGIPSLQGLAPLVQWSAKGLAFRTTDKVVLVNAVATSALVVGKAGTGNGTVTTSPSGVQCGSTCAALFASTSTVTLTATPDSTSSFVEWQGDADCADAEVSMTTAHSCRAVFAPLSAGPSRQLPLAVNDLVYSSSAGKLYASVPGTDPTRGNTVVEIDPTSGDVLRSVWVGSEPTRLALSDDGGTMYVGLNGAFAVRRIDMATFMPGLQFPLGRSGSSGPYVASDMAVIPGEPDSVVVVRGESPSGGYGSVAVFTSGVMRTKTTTSSSVRSIAFGASSSRLYGTSGSSSGNLARMNIAGDGVTLVDDTWALVPAYGDHIAFDHGRLYGSGSNSYSAVATDPVSLALLGTFPGVADALAPEFAGGLVYTISGSGSTTLRAFSLDQFGLRWTLGVVGAGGTPKSLVSTSSGALAFRTSASQVFLVDTALGQRLVLTKGGTGGGGVANSASAVSCGNGCATLVPSGTSVSLSATPNAGSRFVGWTGDADCFDGIVTMTAPLSCTAVFAQLTTGLGRQIPLSANDLAYSPATGLIYASVPGTHPVYGNSVAAIDPGTGAITASVVVGSEPGKMAVSSDGLTMFVALGTTGAVRRVDLATMTAGTEFWAGRDPTLGPYGIGDLAVVPGSADDVLVSRTRSGSFSLGYVALFKGGVATGTAAGSGYIAYSSSPSRAYANDYGDLVRLDVGSGGVTLVDSTSNLFGSSGVIRFDQDRLFAGNGRVVDPATKTIVGTFALSSYYTMSTGAAPDVSRGSVYFLVTPTYSTWRVNRYSPTTFTLLDSQEVSGVSGNEASLITCGTGRVAFRTDAGQIFIVTMGAPVTHTLSVKAANPAGEVPITVSPSDLDGLGSGVTPLVRTYASETSVTLTAPLTAGGNVFAYWSGLSTTWTSPSVTVNVNASTQVTAVYRYPVPAVTSVQPASGPTAGGTQVTLTGGNFRSGDTVSVGGSPASSVVVVDSTTITAVTPAHMAGIVGVTVNGSGGSATLPNSFTFVAPPAIPVSPAYDFDRDGRQDIVWFNASWQATRILCMNGAVVKGGWGGMLLPPGANWEIAVATDLNGDGVADLVWRNYLTGANLVYYMADPENVLSQAALPSVPDVNWRLVAAADFDADGRVDLVWRNRVTGYNTVWFMNGAAQLGEAPLPTVPDTAWLLAGVSDFNGDGKPDLVWRSSTTGQNVVWYMDGTSMLSQVFLPPVLDTAWQLALAADFNGDGKPDLLWRNTSTGQNGLWYMDGLVYVGSDALPVETDQNWRIVGQPPKAASKVPGDFNGDGHPDIVWRNGVSGLNVVWCMNGATFGHQEMLPAVGDRTWFMQATADFNGDGWPDLVWRNSVTGQNVVWLMRGVEFQSQVLLSPVADVNWAIVGAADFTGDGKPDLLWRNKVTGLNVVWQMDGTSFVTQSLLPVVADANWRIAGAADFTGDGKPDILWRNGSTGLNVVWVMNGVTFASQVLLPAVADANWQIGMTGDFDGDGSTDIVWRNYSTGLNVIWFMNRTTFVSQSVLPVVGDVNWGILRRP